jgi:hypothetical protein
MAKVGSSGLAVLLAGLADLRHRRRLWPGLYLVQVVLAMLLVLPVWAGLDRHLAHAPRLATLLASGDLGLADEVLGRLSTVGAALLALGPVVLLLGYLVRLFLLGGTVRALARPGVCLSTDDFLAACGQGFMPLCRLAAVFAVGHVLALGMIGGLGYGAYKLTDETLLPQAPQLAMAAAALPGLLAWLVVVTAHDYARVMLLETARAGRPPQRPWRLALDALRAVTRENRTRLWVQLASILLGLAVLCTGAAAARFAGAAGALWIGASLGFGLRQATTFLRTGIHLARYRSVLLLLAPAGDGDDVLVTM